MFLSHIPGTALILLVGQMLVSGVLIRVIKLSSLKLVLLLNWHLVIFHELYMVQPFIYSDHNI